MGGKATGEGGFDTLAIYFIFAAENKRKIFDEDRIAKLR